MATAVNAATRIAESPPGQAYERMRSRLPCLEERPFATPFGTIKLPEFSPPILPMVTDAPGSIEALKAAAAIDLSFPISFVPVIGDLVADVVEDIYAEKLKAVLTAQQYTDYIRHDKMGPSSVAVMRALVGR